METTSLVFDRVTKVYGEGDTAVHALRDVSLEVKRGEFVAVVGPSGSGKTTLLAIAGALLEPTGGTVLLGGAPLTGARSAKETARIRLQQVGFVLQSSNLVPYLTARDQLILVAQLARKRDRQAYEKADKLLKELGIRERANHYPESLSGGERQRVAIARALMNDPEMILADEPTANLDSARGREVVELLSRQIKDHRKAGVMVTHDERMLDVCDRVIHIVDGELKASA